MPDASNLIDVRATRVDTAGYLRRLGLVHPGAPSVAALARIHRAQVETIAYNTLDLHLGRRSTVDPYESAARVVTTGRAGYCFGLNGALAVLLASLGYQVRWHRGGVWHNSDDLPRRLFPNHLALTVRDLPAPDNPGGVWLVDAGLGDALHEPVPLRAGQIRQGPFTYRLGTSPVLAGGWRFEHDPAGAFTGMDFEPDPATPSDFAEAHEHLSTSPESGFVQFISAARRDATGVDRLISATVRRVDATGSTERVLTSARDWFAVLADTFRLPLDDIDARQRATLWRRARAAQDEWEARERVGGS